MCSMQWSQEAILWGGDCLVLWDSLCPKMVPPLPQAGLSQLAQVPASSLAPGPRILHVDTGLFVSWIPWKHLSSSIQARPLGFKIDPSGRTAVSLANEL